MKPIPPRPPEEDKHIYTEGIDYSQTDPVSIWGTGDPDTLEYLKTVKLSGTWLNLAAGDGRYSTTLLKKADRVIAADIDESALSKLVATTPKALQSKLTTAILDHTKPFPYTDGTFDGVFCMGFLHMFPTDIFREMVAEMKRVLKPGGRIVLDFAAHLLRELPDGTLYTRASEPLYGIDEAIELLGKLFSDYQVQMIRSRIPPEEVHTRGLVYKFSCRYVILQADKP
ncbi:hypothetical protein AUK40_03825 [Candidatus Wirthbacteria bacterium CG2_30_54_11]|uniref:Methyltransferase domain-containing protein n=1 Tax=Candidatus Wirthbacteria bacterium CG2_30_54_11 TaxID=1817892 RepID=A0A1J5IJ71_9BACT|nr:MAG: hypothetical protein AUK40_03825 [Candidatus Wirthbacteria bacterium CG2_30_54_11]